MAAKKPVGVDDLDDLFKGIEDVSQTPATAAKAPKATAASNEDDLFADLEKDLAKEPARPHTPRVGLKSKPTPPPPAAGRASEEKPAPRKSADSTRSFHNSFTPSATSSDVPETEKKSTAPEPEPAHVQDSAKAAAAAGGGWWGSVFATATAAVSTAQAAVKEFQQNEETQKWAEQVRGNVGALRGIGGELRQRALPTFTNILHTLAPPISTHERLQIHITHDLVGYPSLDPLVYGVFARVMSQVEGGDLMVIQRGQGSTARRASDAGYTGSGIAGWHDGPWWRQNNEQRDIGSVKGLIEGTKLVRASAEGYANEFYAAHGGLEKAAQRATEVLSESNPVRSSDIFLAIQAIAHDAPTELFQGAPQDKSGDSVVEDDSADELISFAVYLHDPIHSITFHSLSQAVPAKWIRWLDAASPLTPASSTSASQPQTQRSGFFGRDGGDTWMSNMPEEIQEIVESGGVDPREWVGEWLEEVLSLNVGVVAQRYVARRMGVGEGGIGRGKARMEDVVEDGGGEAARAGIII